MRAVIDTNVLFEGLTKTSGASNIIVKAWSAELFEACYSMPLGYEYQDVLARKLSEKRWELVRPILDKLFSVSTQIIPRYQWRPISPDPDDDFVIECAVNAGAIIVTHNIKDFRSAKKQFGLEVMKPHQFLEKLYE